MASSDAMGSSPQEGCFQVSFSSIPLQSLKYVVSSATGLFLQVLSSKCPIYHPPHFLISHFLFPVFYYPPLQSSPGHGSSLVSCVSVVSSGYVLTPDDSKRGSTNQREEAGFVLRGLHHLTLYNIF